LNGTFLHGSGVSFFVLEVLVKSSMIYLANALISLSLILAVVLSVSGGIVSAAFLSGVVTVTSLIQVVLLALIAGISSLITRLRLR
jgi:hypothetical protein